MSTTVNHAFEPIVTTLRPSHLGDARLVAEIHFAEQNILVLVKDPALAEGYELVAEIDITQVDGQLRLCATTNRQLDRDLEGEPPTLLYDPARPYYDNEEVN